MKKLNFMSCLLALTCLSSAASAYDLNLNIGTGTAAVHSSDTLYLEHIQIQNVTNAWGYAKWNTTTNAFDLVDFGSFTPAGGFTGNWQLAYDWSCNGTPGYATWEFYANGLGKSIESSVQVVYDVAWSSPAADRLVVNYQSDPFIIYEGSLSNGVITGHMGLEGSMSGCFSATRLDHAAAPATKNFSSATAGSFN